MNQPPVVLFIAGLPDDRTIVIDDMDPAGAIRQFHVPGVSDYHARLPLAGVEKRLVFVQPDTEQNFEFRTPGLVFNLITNPDLCGKALARAIDLARRYRVDFTPTIDTRC